MSSSGNGSGGSGSGTRNAQPVAPVAFPNGLGGWPPPAPAPAGTTPGAQATPGPPPGTKITVVNGTADPRIVWEDGHVAIIYAKDFPAGTGMGRSKTRSDIKDAINATIDDALHTMPGKGSFGDFVKVWLKDLLARPLSTGPGPQLPKRLPVDPKDFRPVSPVIATSGRYKGQIIPDFPHDCPTCGGKYYQGMFSSIHPTEDGECPATKPKLKKR